MIPLTEGDRRGAIEALSPGMAILARLPHAVPAAFRALWPLLLASVGDERGAAALKEARRLVGAFRPIVACSATPRRSWPAWAGDKARARTLAAGLAYAGGSEPARPLADGLPGRLRRP